LSIVQVTSCHVNTQVVQNDLSINCCPSFDIGFVGWLAFLKLIYSISNLLELHSRSSILSEFFSALCL
jgi:hypothetical protein